MDRSTVGEKGKGETTMGSRLMHAAIAKLLMTNFDQLDMGFLIGNEAPDVDKI